jgi:large subunit ribosomal protein L21
MSLRRSLLALNRRILGACLEDAAAACSGAALGGRAAAPAAAAAVRPLLSLADFRGFASSEGVRLADALDAASSAPAAAFDAAEPPMYEATGRRLAGAVSPTRARVFAIVEVGGAQHKVTPDDLLVVEKLTGVDVNDVVRLPRVLLLGSAAETLVGRPFVPGAEVLAAVEEQFLDGKVLIFHKRRRKNSRRMQGHRQPLTTLRVLEIVGIAEAAEGAAAAPPS